MGAPSTSRAPRTKQTARKTTGKGAAGQKVSQTAGPSREAYLDTFGGYENFMNSHGLKSWDDSDVEMGDAIMDEFGYH
ncbi:hypothetical protein P691DRAFT_676506 [Macrolepiota fuliginosa MF-IS2]|uniref:Uncharacterized protein n=1 Tax=Macrolepiota fuliginosa MF-IS2 TaxID=1400762 RepID=A0A9P5X6J2_9AGAR|nr:hypothetical protein P691DRAFT_682490 [Macrolepiota fuliginosa MF-IS2]KAF9445005.1 hypothetical protein P691DRAFT_676506 [Macrolepiota fuliginosa MF-IS2]